jgi:hypothetical protein
MSKNIEHNLIEKARQGNPAAIAELFKKHGVPRERQLMVLSGISI